MGMDDQVLNPHRKEARMAPQDIPSTQSVPSIFKNNSNMGRLGGSED